MPQGPSESEADSRYEGNLGAKKARRKSVKITKTDVDKLQPSQVLWDAVCRGFAVRCQRRDKVFVLRITEDGRFRWISIGKYGHPSPTGEAWTVEMARREAERLKGQEGVAAKRDAIKIAETVSEAIDTFEDKELAQKRPNTVTYYRMALERYVRPALGNLKLRDVKHAHIRALHRQISETHPTTANRVAAILSKLFNLAVKDELIQHNPVKGLERNPENKRERYLTAEELAHITAALDGCLEPQSADVVRLLLLTGARRGEALSATWDQFDLEQGVWTKPSSHTKQKRLHRVPLSPGALTLLMALRKDAEEAAHETGEDVSPFVFPGKKEKTHLTSIKKTWEGVRERATIAMWATKPNTAAGSLVNRLTVDGKLPDFADVAAIAKAEEVELPAGITDVRIHDQRHTYASILVSSGCSLPIIGALLGHTQAQTTARYAHLFDDPLREATARVSAVIQTAGGGGSNVVKIRQAGK